MNRFKARIANSLLKYLFNTITVDDILVYNPNDKTFTVADKVLPLRDRQDIVNGANSMQRMYIWEMLNKDMKFQANKLIFEKSETIDDMIFGKAILYTLDVMELKLKNLSKLQ